MKKDTDRYLFALQVHPRVDGACNFSADDVTSLLGVHPTEVDPSGSWSNNREDWLWTYSLEWQYSGGCIGDISSILTAFLQRLPSNHQVWEELSQECEYFLYLPLERDYFLIEFSLDHNVFHELATRMMTIEFSAKSCRKNKQNKIR